LKNLKTNNDELGELLDTNQPLFGVVLWLLSAFSEERNIF